MGVVAAGVGNRHLLAFAVEGTPLARVRQPRTFLHRQSVHVRAQHHGGAVAVVQHTCHAVATDTGDNVEPALLQAVGGQGGRALLLV